jgi:excisionase family DNA binding protein
MDNIFPSSDSSESIHHRFFPGNRLAPEHERMIEDRRLSVEGIAAYLELKRDTPCKWIERNPIPAHKVDRLWKFGRDEVDQWVRHGGVSEAGL